MNRDECAVGLLRLRLIPSNARLDRRSKLCYKEKAMLSRIMISVGMAAALLVAPMSISARSCILLNAPAEKACQPGCCANKTCCATSQKNTAPAAQPLAKSGSDQQSVATLPSAVAVVGLSPAAETSSIFSSRDCMAHSPPPLALSCIRLI
jgi:hypothetical protein